jgi:hypothetical protein
VEIYGRIVNTFVHLVIQIPSPSLLG